MEYLLFQEEEQNDNGSIFVAADKPNDNDLIKIYNFFIYKGYYNIVSIQFINLLTTIFLYFLFIFLVLCIDYPGLIEIKTQEENFINYINFGNILNTNFFYL